MKLVTRPTPCKTQKKDPAEYEQTFRTTSCFFSIRHVFSCGSYFRILKGVGGCASSQKLSALWKEAKMSEKDIHNVNYRSTARSGCGEHAKSWMAQVDNEGSRRHLQHTSQDLQLAMAFLARQTTQCGAGGRAGGKACRDGRTRGCRWCSKSACWWLVRLSVQPLAHGRGLGRTGRRRQRWLMALGWQASRGLGGPVGGRELVGNPAGRTSGRMARSLEGWSSASHRLYRCQQCSCGTISIS